MKKFNDISDEALLRDFFGDRTEHIEDGGFTERVVAALPQRQTAWVTENLRLRRWSAALNLTALVGGIILLFTLDAFGSVRAAVGAAIQRTVMGLLTFDWGALLVQTMLFFHRLPELLPNATQLAGIMLSLMILTAMSVKKLASSV